MGSEFEVGSADWCAAALELCQDLPHRPGITFRIQFTSTAGEGPSLDWHQVVEDGRVLAWEPGPDAHPDLEVHLAHDVWRAVFRGEVAGTDALAAMHVRSPGGELGVAPPLDIRDVTELGDLPVFPDAALVVQYDFAAGPFGPVALWMAFEDGRCSGIDFGQAADPDVGVKITFAKMAAVRLGEITILEALEDGGEVVGDLGPLMLLAGLEESPELRVAEQACGSAGAVLGVVGTLAQTTEYRSVLSAVAALTR